MKKLWISIENIIKEIIDTLGDINVRGILSAIGDVVGLMGIFYAIVIVCVSIAKCLL